MDIKGYCMNIGSDSSISNTINMFQRVENKEKNVINNSFMSESSFENNPNSQNSIGRVWRESGRVGTNLSGKTGANTNGSLHQYNNSLNVEGLFATQNIPFGGRGGGGEGGEGGGEAQNQNNNQESIIISLFQVIETQSKSL